MTVYGEICGYESGLEKAIMKNYDYGCKPGENFIMIYRISTKDEETGKTTEWDVSDVRVWTTMLIDRMKEEGDENWKRIHPIDILYHGSLYNLYPEIDPEEHWHENFLEKLKNDKDNFGMEEYEPLCTEHQVPREGICIRIDNDPVLECYKLKGTSFRFYEASLVDAGEVDMEMEQAYQTDNNVEDKQA